MKRKPFESEIYVKLQEAEREAETTEKRYSSEDVLKAMREAIVPQMGEEVKRSLRKGREEAVGQGLER